MNIRQLLTRNAWSSSVVSREIRYRERFEFAIALSLLVHAFILALRFGAAGFGLPWGEERAEAPPVTLRMSEELRSAEPSPPAASIQRDEPPAAPPALAGAPSTARVTTLEVRLVPAPAPPAPAAAPRRETRTAKAAARTRARERVVKARPAPRILAQAKPEAETFKVPEAKRVEPEPQRAPDSAAKPQTEEPRPPDPAVEQMIEQARRESEEAARAEAEDAARRRAEEDARQRALARKKAEEAKQLAEAKRLEDARKEEEARREALELEAKKLAEDKTRQEAEELARQRAVAQKKEEEAKKLEEARRIEEKKKEEEARVAELKKKEEEGRRVRLEMEALKRAEELAKLQAEAKRKALEAQKAAEEAAKLKEAQRLAEEAARAREAERKRAEADAQRERERLAAQKAGPAAPGQLSGLDIAKKAIEDLRNPGTPRGDPRRPPGPPTTAENPRRRSVFGIERDVMVRSYIESWRSKLERYGSFNYRRSASRSSLYDNPIVTVAIRSDGSLEDVRIHRSSGLREIDEAIFRISELHAPYAKFPPALARQYDVIEIRRVWSFEDTLKILDEM
ncbi:MAG TPA: hypothetical protein VHP37_19970 [Burkholderiales bacterium]|nr:hypothetical protein [Burkholderiales bacterium]